MIAAIYARKSTDQSGVAEEQKSVARQVEHATAYAVAKGWTVDPRFVFVDDNISGSEFDKRPGFLRLMNSLKPKPLFQVLVMSELSRLGREQLETGYAVKQFSQAGVKIVSYLEGQEIALESPIGKFLMSAVSFAAEIEKQKGSQRTTDAMLRKARAGHVTGGTVFGYENVRLTDHVERRIVASEASVIRRIYELAAAGSGSRHIAHLLNEQGVPTPRAQRGRPSGWDQGTIRAVLERQIYRGVVEYGKTKKRDAWGQKKITARPATDLIRVDKPELRIISPSWPRPSTPFARTDASGTYAGRKDSYLGGQCSENTCCRVCCAAPAARTTRRRRRRTDGGGATATSARRRGGRARRSAPTASPSQLPKPRSASSP